MSALDALRHELLDEATVDALLDRLEQRQTMREPDGWLRGAEKIAAYIDCPQSRVYSLSSAGRIPVERDGSNLIARRSDLDAWVRNGGAKRP